MANVAVAMQASLLNWSPTSTGTAPTRPAGCFAGVSLGTPTSVSSSEVATGSGVSRQTVLFAAAATPASSGSCSNSAAITFGPFSSSCVISGVFLNDSTSSGAGTYLYFGNLSTVRTPLVGDSLVFAVGALAITMA